MRCGAAGLLFLAAVAVLWATMDRGHAVQAPFEEGFEAWAVGAYPNGDGWIALSLGKSGLVSSARAHSGSKSFLLDSWPWSARTDYVRLDQIPDALSYEAAVYVDPTYGKAACVGFVKGPGTLSNYFRVDGSKRLVSFFGAGQVDLAPYTPGSWCVVRADLDFTQLKGNISVNGVAIAEQVDITANISGTTVINRWGLHVPSPSFSGSFWGNVVYFDDIRIQEWVRTIQVRVDIKPGVYPNVINLGSRGVVPVAIFSDENFDAAQADVSTVTVGGAPIAQRGKQKKWMAHLEDVDGDGLADLLIQVETRNLSAPDDGCLQVTGQLSGDGPEFEGEDEVVIMPR